jgi:high affinity sulfate transporter 1
MAPTPGARHDGAGGGSHRAASPAEPSRTTASRAALTKFVPGIHAVAEYKPAWLPRDLMAGLVLATLLVPQGMAYAQLAGLPPITGLYTSMLCLVSYAVFGPSRILVLGPDSSLGPMIAATVLPLVVAGGDPDRAVQLAGMLALLVGAITIGVGVAKLGFIADLLSKPTQIGYLVGLALTIFVGQLPKLFGFSIDADGLIEETKEFVNGVADGKTVGAAVVVGVSGLVLILVLQRLVPKFPALLLTVVLSIAAVSLFDLTDEGVSVVGALPKGFPPFDVPSVMWSDLPALLAGAAGIALVALTDTISTSSAFAAKRGDPVRSNQEMIGIGAANVGAGLFQGFAVSTSGSRTAVAEQAGAKTQLTGVVGATVIAAMLLFVPGLLRNLPQPTLAAVVITASLSLADVKGLRRLWRVRRVEFSLALAAFLGVALLGVLAGIAVAVGLSILNVFRRAWWPYDTVLGEVDGLDGFHDMRSYPDAHEPAGIIVYRFDAPLFFANSRTFSEQVRELTRRDPAPRSIVVAAAAITDVDTTAADMLADLVQDLEREGIEVVFAELKDPVRRKLARYEFTNVLESADFHPTVETAVTACSVRSPDVAPAPAPQPRRAGDVTG